MAKRNKPDALVEYLGTVWEFTPLTDGAKKLLADVSKGSWKSGRLVVQSVDGPEILDRLAVAEMKVERGTGSTRGRK